MQEIITYIILSITFGLTVYKSVKFFIDTKQGKSHCSSCNQSCSSSCSLKNYKPIISEKLQV